MKRFFWVLFLGALALSIVVIGVTANLFTSVIREYIVNNLMSACLNRAPQKLLIVNA